MSATDIVIIIGAVTTAIGIVTTNIINIIIAARTKRITENVEAAVAEVHTVVNSKNDALVKEVSELKVLVAELRQDKANLAAANQ